jgi:predicted PurR-regulated permease PerM
MLCSAIYAYTHGQSFAALCILLMSVVIGLVDNVVRPLLMKGSSELSFFWLFLTIVGGVSMFGVSGAILGPWAFALFLAIKAQDVTSQSL